MRRDQEELFDPKKPTLIVKYGATRRKYRPLEAEITVIGRGHGCDIGIVSPEVAPVHCVIVRLNSCWRIRDCSNRSTLLNGVAIQDEILRDGDTIQIGTFSFEAHLPAGARPPVVGGKNVHGAHPRQAAPEPPPVNIEHLQQSRKRLAEMAISLRRRLRDQAAAHQTIEREQMDLERLEQRLRNTHQENLSRKAELDRRSEELDTYAKHLRREVEKFHRDQLAKVAQIEQERADYEADLVQERVEMQQQHQELATWQNDLARRQAQLEMTTAQSLEEISHAREILELERTQLAHDREQLVREREYLDLQRQEIVHHRQMLNRIQTPESGQQPVLLSVPISSRETQLDSSPINQGKAALKSQTQSSDRKPTGGSSTSVTKLS